MEHNTKFKHTPQQKKEMYEFLDWLQENATPEQFDMSVFRDDREFDKIIVCGTAACVCGWMPPYFKSKDWEIPYEDDKCIDFYDIPERFGFDPLTHTEEWDWCFGGLWVGTDNTIEGAIARIKYLYEKGLPENSGAQKRGEAPISYGVKSTTN